MPGKNGQWRVDFVDALYGGLVGSGSFQSALQVAGKRLRAGNGALALYCGSSGEVRILGSYRYSERYLNDYPKFAHLDPWPLVYERSGSSPTDCILSQDWISDRELESTEFYQDFWRHHGLGQTAGAYLPFDDKWSVMVSFPRLADDAPYRSEDRADISFATRHLSYAATLFERIQFAEERAALRQFAFDRLDFAVALVSGDGALLEANEAARALIGKDRLFRVKQGCLQGTTVDNRSTLARGLSSLLGVNPNPPSAMRFQQPASGHTWNGYLWPVEWHGRTLYFLIVLDAGCREPGAMRALGELLGLTQAELAVLTGLLAGRSLEEIAETRQVSRDTVRSQVKSLMDKTGCHRQGQLVAMAARMSPPVVEGF